MTTFRSAVWNAIVCSAGTFATIWFVLAAITGTLLPIAHWFPASVQIFILTEAWLYSLIIAGIWFIVSFVTDLSDSWRSQNRTIEYFENDKRRLYEDVDRLHAEITNLNTKLYSKKK